MNDRGIIVDLGGGEATVTVTIKGSACAVSDYTMLAVHHARRFKRRRLERAKPFLKKPCGCKEKDV